MIKKEDIKKILTGDIDEDADIMFRLILDEILKTYNNAYEEGHDDAKKFYNKRNKKIKKDIKKNIVIINKSHTLLPEQEFLLNNEFNANNWERFNVPIDGLGKQKMKEICEDILNNDVCGIVFASPIPYMMKLLFEKTINTNIEIKVFHNDNRDKVELPNGRIIMKVSQTGWELL